MLAYTSSVNSAHLCVCVFWRHDSGDIGFDGGQWKEGKDFGCILSKVILLLKIFQASTI